ncbi:MAG: hypothetical protein M1830_010330 [Pleopsidium flavum]|nr:MAG: hypothetical protein M1830_010330 [Pleopsidium flavum]
MAAYQSEHSLTSAPSTLEAISCLTRDIEEGLASTLPRLHLGTQYYNTGDLIPEEVYLRIMIQRCAGFGDPKHWYMQNVVPAHLTEAMVEELVVWLKKSKMSILPAAKELAGADIGESNSSGVPESGSQGSVRMDAGGEPGRESSVKQNLEVVMDPVAGRPAKDKAWRAGSTAKEQWSKVDLDVQGKQANPESWEYVSPKYWKTRGLFSSVD